MGIEVSLEAVAISILGADGIEVASSITPAGRHPHSPRSMALDAFARYSELARGTDLPDVPASVVIAVPGLVTRSRLRVPAFAWTEDAMPDLHRIAPLIVKHLDVLNDGDAAVVAEARTAAGPGMCRRAPRQRRHRRGREPARETLPRAREAQPGNSATWSWNQAAGHATAATTGAFASTSPPPHSPTTSTRTTHCITTDSAHTRGHWQGGHEPVKRGFCSSLSRQEAVSRRSSKYSVRSSARTWSS